MRTPTLLAVAVILFAGTAHAAPKTNVVDLGVLKGDGFSGPGDVLAGKVENVGPGGAISFVAPTNQIWGLGELTVSPASAAKVTQTLVKAKVPGALGGATYYRYTITLAKDVTAPVKVTSSGNFQTRNSPHWAFSFDVSPAPRAGEIASAGEYHPIPLIPGYMGGSEVPGSNVGRDASTRGAAAAQPSGRSMGGAGVKH